LTLTARIPYVAAARPWPADTRRIGTMLSPGAGVRNDNGRSGRANDELDSKIAMLQAGKGKAPHQAN
jgi:hypothetical protein